MKKTNFEDAKNTFDSGKAGRLKASSMVIGS